MPGNTIALSEPSVNQLMEQGWVGLQIDRGVNSTNLASFQVIGQVPYVANQTNYLYSDLTGAASDWYRVARYGPGVLGAYSAPWPVVPAPLTVGDGARRSLRSCRRMLARKLGSIQVTTTTADGSPDGTTLTSRGLATRLDPNRYRQWWVMPTDGVSAGEVRRLSENALNPSSGVLTFEPPMFSQIVSGTQVELHKLLPPDENDGDLLGLRQALNLALAECWVLDRVAISGTGLNTLNLASFGDWLDAEAVHQVYGAPIGSMPSAPYGGYAVHRDAETIALDIVGIQSGTNLPVEVTRPGDSYMRISGVWTDNQQGFASDLDECLFQPQFLTEVALVYCYEALANATTGAPGQRYLRLADDKRKGVNIMKFRGLPHPPEYPHRGGAIGDEWYGSGGYDSKSLWTI